ncbi:MAG: SIR2 family protein [Verrucomicrobiia bacterium]
MIRELAGNDQVERLDIVTLNHDVLVERLLEENKIEYTDGFIPHNGVPRFDATAFENKTVKTRLFKLHGSIDWRKHTNRNYGCVKVSLDEADNHLKDANGKDLEGRTLPDLPLLAGTLNKEHEYGYGISEVLFYDWFRKLLPQNQIIVMSGFGWVDYDISLRIRNWLLFDKEQKRKLVLLYEKPEENVKARLGSDGDCWWDKLRKRNQLVLPGKWLRDTTAAEVLSLAKDV